MNNGTITNNESTSYGGGIALVLSEGEYFDCDGLGQLQSSVTINNGTISNNSSTIGAGITITEQRYAKAAPICYYNYSEEGTPPANPGLHINGGSVENNTAADSGGGICINGVDPSKDISIKNALITGNKADNGYGGNDAIQIDHRDCNAYRIATFVVTYEDHPENLGKDIIARAYMRYYDANGLLRTFYNDYDGTNVYGGCSISYNDAYTLAGI